MAVNYGPTRYGAQQLSLCWNPADAWRWGPPVDNGSVWRSGSWSRWSEDSSRLSSRPMQSFSSDTLRSIDDQWALLAYTVPFELQYMLPGSDDDGVWGAVAVSKYLSSSTLPAGATNGSSSSSLPPCIGETIESSRLSSLFIKLNRAVVAPREEGTRD